jgi:hypothetical protein
VRHVRMLGLCLAALFALSAMTAGQALAKEACKQYGERCETLEEHASFQALANCPFETAGVEFCAAGSSYEHETTGKGKSNKESAISYFTAGKVTVDLKKPIRLRIGMVFSGIVNEFNAAAPVGVPAIEPVAQAGPPLTKDVNTALLSTSELERYDYWVHHAKETKTSATIEMAGPVESLHVNLANIIGEHGSAFVFPVKVKLSSPFVGNDCYVGSDENPIDVPFTTGEAGELHGKAGRFEEESDTILVDYDQTLVSSEFASPGVEGCGVDGGADEAIDSAFGLPSASGNTSLLNAVFRLAVREEVEKGLKGEI